MRSNAKGIFLGKVRLSESTEIYKILTDSFGLCALVMKGRRSGSQRLAACGRPLALLTVSADFRTNKDLVTGAEVTLLSPLHGLYEHPVKSAMAAFIAEVLLRGLQEHYVNPELFDFLCSEVALFSEEPLQPDKHLTILMGIAERLGFAPDVGGIGSSFDSAGGTRCNADKVSPYAIHPPESTLFIRLAQAEVGFDKRERSILTELMINYFRLHLPKMGEVRSLEVLRLVFG